MAAQKLCGNGCGFPIAPGVSHKCPPKSTKAFEKRNKTVKAEKPKQETKQEQPKYKWGRRAND